MVQTHLVARLLGVRLLKVDGVVNLAPARLERRTARVTDGSVTAVPAADLPATGLPAAEAPGILGGGLAHAQRLVEDGDRRLR